MELLRGFFRWLAGLFVRQPKPMTFGAADAVLVSDFDAMVASPVAFKLHGRVHYLRPVTTKEFMAYSNALLSFQRLDDAKLTSQEVLDIYLEFIKSVCDSIGPSDIKQMTQPQAGALMKLIIDHVTGRTHAPEASESEKKN